MKKLQALLIAGVATGALIAASAQASVIIDAVDDVGESFVIDFDGAFDGDVQDGLTAEATFTFDGIESYNFGGTTGFLDSYKFTISINNNSTTPITASRVSSIGFDIDPDIFNADAVGIFGNAVLGGSYPGGFGAIDVCFTEGNTCQGGQSGGILIGGTEEVTIWLGYNQQPVPSPITLSNFGVRYQSIEGAGPNRTSAVGSGTPGNGTPVPEPATLTLLGIGLLGAGYMARRRRLEA